MINNLVELLKVTDNYYDYLKQRNFKFNKRGFPLFEKEMFLTEYPKMVVPYSQRNNRRVTNRKDVVLCTFSKDSLIYPRLKKIFEEIAEYKKYKGVIISDLTVTRDMDIEYQNLLMLINQLYGAILAANGIKIVMNARNGLPDTLKNFDNVPKDVMYASSRLGCSKQDAFDLTYIRKIIYLQPSRLILYGKHDFFVENYLDNIGFDFVCLPDFHTLCIEDNNLRRCA